jgi:hypothetical protein
MPSRGIILSAVLRFSRALPMLRDSEKAMSLTMPASVLIFNELLRVSQVLKPLTALFFIRFPVFADAT